MLLYFSVLETHLGQSFSREDLSSVYKESDGENSVSIHFLDYLLNILCVLNKPNLKMFVKTSKNNIILQHFLFIKTQQHKKRFYIIR